MVYGLGRRVAKKTGGVFTVGYLWDGELLVAEVNSLGTITSRYVYGSKKNIPDYVIKGSVTYRIFSDHLGSPRLIVNTANNAVVQRIDYDEFGLVTTDTNPGFTPFGYAGGLYDKDTKFVRFGVRDYDPETGRWTSKDPVRFEGGDSNLYGYIFDDPINGTDPSGKDAFENTIEVGGFGIGAAEAVEGLVVGGLAIATAPATITAASVAITAEAGWELYNHWNDNPNRGWGSDLPVHDGPPNGSLADGRGDEGTIRDYDENGDAKTDYDFGRDHKGAGDPHAHDWNWSRGGKISRGCGRPLKEGE